ncbi:MAG: hypothetical protein EZS28_035958 [Streblomastix strix]|uniref:Uncharacterized protein n=1 Tax=Streblomastix strix TaxID=222440 RepID=A0A5J4UCJ3_9EUKA|nr:MAG: hypothetical protein EZS28_035958 [Streblomastix strix]
MKTPEQRRFRLDPTFQWAVSVVPIADNSPIFFTRPSPKVGQKSSIGANKPIVRISFRAVIVVDESVFVGVKYDGPDANFLSVIKNNWSVALKQFPRKFGFFDSDNRHGYKEENMNITIRNGLENEWKVLQTVEMNKKNLCIADADTFIFFEEDIDQPNSDSEYEQKHQIQHHPHHHYNNISLFEMIIRIRHVAFTTAMRLEPFPIRKKPFIMPSFEYTSALGREKDGEVADCGLNEIENRGRIQLPEYIPQFRNINKSKHKQQKDDQSITSASTSTETKSQTNTNNLSYTTGIALIDSPAGTSAIQLLFNFDLHHISLHSFAIAALPPSISRVMAVIDENRVMKTLKGQEIQIMNRVHAGTMSNKIPTHKLMQLMNFTNISSKNNAKQTIS